MDAKGKQQWTNKVTQCFLAPWSSSKVQNKLEGASWAKPVFESIKQGVAVAGHDQTLNRLMNKLMKLKKDYRDPMKELEAVVVGLEKESTFPVGG